MKFVIANIGLLFLALGQVSYADARPPIQEHITFQYYLNLSQATEFYEKALQMTIVKDTPWYKIFQVTPHSYLGIVDISKKPKDLPFIKKESLFSWVVSLDGVQKMFNFLKARNIPLPQDPVLDEESGVKGFKFQDPEGYPIEVFAWIR